MKKRLHILFMALLAMAVLGGCGADGTGESSEDTSSKEQNVQETEISEGPVYGGSVVVGIQQDIDSLDPHKATAAGTKEILFNVFEGLVKPDENGNLICAVASDYSISDDGLVYTFTLRDGVKFHNGNDVTCEDVKYSLERVAGLLDGTPLVATLQTIQAEKMQRRIRLEQDRFLLFLTLHRRESFLRRMKITGRKDFLILMR